MKMYEISDIMGLIHEFLYDFGIRHVWDGSY